MAEPSKELLQTIGRRFIQRKDVKAEQDAKGYHPVKSKFTMEDLYRHVMGNKTYGHYLLDKENNVKLFAFDIDLVTDEVEFGGSTIIPRDAWHGDDDGIRALLTTQLNALAEGLARRAHRLFDLHVAADYSGNKGVHVYAFTGIETAANAKGAAQAVLESFGCFEATRGDNFYRHTSEYKTVEIEIFPKQTELNNDESYGNLLRLPLGIHKKSGQKGHFIKFQPSLAEFTPMRATDALIKGELPWQSR